MISKSASLSIRTGIKVLQSAMRVCGIYTLLLIFQIPSLPFLSAQQAESISNPETLILEQFFQSSAYAAQKNNIIKGRESIGNSGTIDWYAMRLSATGYGAVSPVHGATQGKVLGLRAAIVDARRNLLEVIKGVRIEAETTLANYMTADDRIRSTVKGIVAGATVERSGVLKDGTYYAVLTMPLAGKLGKTITTLPPAPLISPIVQSPKSRASMPPEISNKMGQLEKRLTSLLTELTALKQKSKHQEKRIRELEESLPEQKNSLVAKPQVQTPQAPSPPTPPLRQEQHAPAENIPAAATTPKAAAVPEYSGIVIDARGLNFTPSLRPEIFSAQIMGENFRLYPSENADTSLAAARGYVRYISSVAEAQRLPRIKGLPLTIKAQKTLADNASGLVLDAKATKTLQQLLKNTKNPLDQCRVAIVL